MLSSAYSHLLSGPPQLGHFCSREVAGLGRRRGSSESREETQAREDAGRGLWEEVARIHACNFKFVCWRGGPSA